MAKKHMFLNTLFYLIFFFFSFGQIGRISLLNGQVNFYLYELGALIFLFWLFFKYKFVPIQVFTKKLKIFFVFVLFLLVSFIVSSFRFNWSENGVAFLYLGRFIFYFFYFFYLSFWVKTEKKIMILFNGIYIFVFLTLFTSLLQYFFYPDLRNLFYLGWDPHLYRLFGVFFDTGVAGAIFGMILLSLYQLSINRYLKYFFVGFFLFFLVLTFSRSVYLGFIITCFFYFLSHKKYQYLFFGILIFSLLVLLVPKPSGEGVNLLRIFSINSRLENYKQAIDLWQRDWLVGIGYNHIRYVRSSFKDGNAGASFHSSFLIILVTGGILGLIGWGGLLIGLIKLNKKVMAIILFLSILSLFDNILLHPFVLFFLLSLIPLL